MIIALVGKYTALEDAYASVLKALNHAALFCKRKLVIRVRILFFCSLNAFSVTFPYCSKYFFTSSTVVLADSPPTKIFFVRVTILRRKYVILKKMKRKEKNG